MAKPLKVIRKNRLRALALPFVNNSGLRPELASGDYLMFPIHDGSGHAISGIQRFLLWTFGRAF